MARVPAEIDRRRVRFALGDATMLPLGNDPFDVVLLANLIDRLPEPGRCLEQLSRIIKPGGQLIITSPYTWLEEFTPREHWLGGCAREGRPTPTFIALEKLLSAAFTLTARKDLAFLIREHARKFQWSVADATVWIRNSG